MEIGIVIVAITAWIGYAVDGRRGAWAVVILFTLLWLLDP